MKRTASGALVTGSAAASGSPSGDAAAATGDAEADTATQQASPEALTPSIPPMPETNLHKIPSWGHLSRLQDVHQPQQGNSQLMSPLPAEHPTPALSGFSASQPPALDAPADSEPLTPAISASQNVLCHQNSGALQGLSKGSNRPLGRQRNSINYSLLAGNRKLDARLGSGVHKSAKKGGQKNSPAPQADVRKDQAALAVAAAIAEGEAQSVPYASVTALQATAATQSDSLCLDVLATSSKDALQMMQVPVCTAYHTCHLSGNSVLMRC